MTEKLLTIAYIISFFPSEPDMIKKKKLASHLSQLLVDLSGCVRLESSSVVTLSLSIVKIAGKTIQLDTSSIQMLKNPLERGGLALTF